jgi:hypothetical protein
VIVMVADADFVVSVTEVAVTVTVFPEGTLPGAVYVVIELLPVVIAGLTLPQADDDPQLTVQVTPAALLSFATTAVRLAVAFTATEAGGFEIVTEIDCVPPPPPPHATRTRARSGPQQEKTLNRDFIGFLLS